MISYLFKTKKVERPKFELFSNWQNDEKILNFESMQGGPIGFYLMHIRSVSASAGVENYSIQANAQNLESMKQKL